MVHKRIYAVRMKIRKNRNHDSLICIHCKESYSPACGILGAQGYLHPFLQPCALKQDMQSGDMPCHFRESELLAPVVAQRLSVPIGLDSVLKSFQIMFHIVEF